MDNRFLAWICSPLVICSFSAAAAADPNLEKIHEILSAQKPAISESRIYRSEDSVATRSPIGPRLYKQTVTGTVLIVTKDGIGSGARVGRGLIITNWHVVEGTEYAAIVFWKPDIADLKDLTAKDTVLAAVLEIDRTRDLALLHFDPAKAPPHTTIIQTAELSEVAVGQDVFAIGHPGRWLWSYTEGVVSQVRRNFQWQYESSQHQANVIQTQTPVSFGSSGGPLFDQRGRLIGLNAASKAPGLSIAIAIDEVTSFTFDAIARLKR